MPPRPDDTLEVAARLARLIKTSPVGEEIGTMPADFMADTDVQSAWLEDLSPAARKLLLVLGAATYFGAMEVTQ